MQKEFAQKWAALESQRESILLDTTTDSGSQVPLAKQEGQAWVSKLHILPDMETAVALVRELSSAPEKFSNWGFIDHSPDEKIPRKTSAYVQTGYKEEWKLLESTPLVDVLITGSLHLAGRALDVLEAHPNFQ